MTRFASVPLPRISLPSKVFCVLQDVARRHDVQVGVIVSRSQDRDVVEARRSACISLRACGYSYPQIGRWVNRHHTTVMNLTRGHQEVPTADYDPNAPDESGVWAI